MDEGMIDRRGRSRAGGGGDGGGRSPPATVPVLPLSPFPDAKLLPSPLFSSFFFLLMPNCNSPLSLPITLHGKKKQ